MNGKLCPALLNKLTKQIVEQLHGLGWLLVLLTLLISP